MAGDHFQTTVAAPELLNLRDSVNVVPGPRDACSKAAKVGNATLVHANREAEQYRQAIMAGAIIGAPADPEAFG